MKLTCFSYFGCGFKIKAIVMHGHVLNNQEHVKNAYDQHSSISGTFKEFK